MSKVNAKVIQIRVSQSEYDKIEAAANTLGLCISSYIRFITLNQSSGYDNKSGSQ